MQRTEMKRLHSHQRRCKRRVPKKPAAFVHRKDWFPSPQFLYYLQPGAAPSPVAKRKRQSPSHRDPHWTACRRGCCLSTTNFGSKLKIKHTQKEKSHQKVTINTQTISQKKIMKKMIIQGYLAAKRRRVSPTTPKETMVKNNHQINHFFYNTQLYTTHNCTQYTIVYCMQLYTMHIFL